MTWEQKLEALSHLTHCHLEMRAPGDWFVCCSGRSIAGDGILMGGYGNGSTPQQAVEADWERMTNLPDSKYIQTKEGNYRWSGFMWKKVS